MGIFIKAECNAWAELKLYSVHTPNSQTYTYSKNIHNKKKAIQFLQHNKQKIFVRFLMLLFLPQHGAREPERLAY